jgi:hypothetical protein
MDPCNSGENVMQNANLPGQLFQKKARSRLGCLGQLLMLALILVGVGLLYAILTPWAFFMGGNFHPLGSWAGWGLMKSKTAGDYVLFLGPQRECLSLHAEGRAFHSEVEWRYAPEILGEFDGPAGTPVDGQLARDSADRRSAAPIHQDRWALGPIRSNGGRSQEPFGRLPA